MPRRGGTICLAAIFVAACGGGDSGTGPVLPRDEPPASPDRDADGLQNELDACPDQPETLNGVFDGDGCPDTVFEFYEAVRADVENFWTTEFAEAGLTYPGITAFQPYTTPIETLCGPAVLANAFYCPLSQGVYYDSNFLQAYIDQVGDAAPAFIIGHEIGHHVSWILGWTLILTTKRNELLADCWSGAWIADVDARGFLEEGDAEELVTALFSVGDPADTWFNPTMHGTAQQRTLAFLQGVVNGADGCMDSDFLLAFPE